MIPRSIGVLLLGWLVIIAPGFAGGKKDNLDGAWVLESVELNGKKVEAKQFAGAVAYVEKDTVTLKQGDKVIQKATFTMCASKKPGTMDVVMEQEGKKVTVLQIYKLEGDVLTICGTQPGKERPTDFTSKEGSGRELLVYRRKK